MKQFLALAIAATVAVVALSFTLVPGNTAKTKTSDIVWTGKKVGGQHTGNIAFEQSELLFEKGQLSGGSFTVNMNSMTCSDLEGEYHDKLIRHLKSDDFFSVETYPTARFVITSVKSLGSDRYEVTGDMTIKGKTNQETFETEVSTIGKTVTATSKAIIDRSKYNVKYGSGSFFEGLGDNLIYDDFELDITIKAAL